MRTLLLLSLGALMLLSGCDLNDEGIIIGAPDIKIGCLNAVDDSEVTEMKERIEDEVFKDEKLSRARYVTNDHCFRSYQVVELMDAFVFEDNKLELAKDLYDQTVDQDNYDIVVDELTFKSDRDELRDYIAMRD